MVVNRDEKPDTDAVRRTATFELLFDLVFVFAITQITDVIEFAEGPADWMAAVSVLLFLWWMYGGFVWLASHVDDERKLEATMFLAMLAFFLLAMGIPGVHAGDTVQVGSAAIVVVVIHFAAFWVLAGARYGWPMVRVGVVNLIAAVLVLVAGSLPNGLEWIAQLAVVVLLSGMALVYAAEPFSLIPSHFVERHGLALIIVFGESIIAVGSGISGPAPAHVLAEAGLTLCLVIGLWLTYFARDDERAETVMLATPESERGRIALLAYWAAFAVMIGGVLMLAAGAKLHFGGRSSSDFGGWIAAGVALYLAGTAGFRAVMRIRGALGRLAGAVVALAIAVVPSRENAIAPLLLAVVLVVALFALDTRMAEKT